MSGPLQFRGPDTQAISGVKIFFPDIQKKGSKNVFGHIPVKTCMKPSFLDLYL